jgi:AGCS family alanine or glycine:cation symporter
VVLGGLTIMGGITRIGALAARLVPGMCLLYLGAALLICVMRFEQLDDVLWIILRDGLSGDAMFGGALGSVIMAGIRRAVFSNEAGLGSAGIAHAAVKTDEPVREGLVASLGPFIDTVIVSSATAFVIVLAGLDSTALDPRLEGIALTAAAFERDLPGFGAVAIPIVGFLFALSTMVTWSFYGETATAYLVGRRGVKPYRLVFVALAYGGATQELGVVISFSDAMVGLLVIPNMLTLLLLSGRVATWTRDYFDRLARGEFERS